MTRWISVSAMGLAAALSASTLAAPAVVAPGGSVAVPSYDGRTPTTTTVMDAKCGYFTMDPCTTGTTLGALQATGEAILASPGGFMEAAGTTALNPYGSNDVALAFIFGGAQAPSITSATLSMLGGYSTSVEACAPVFGSSFGCAPGSAGTALRSAGSGDNLTFTSLGQTTILGLPATDGYIVYTNAPASALTDPNNNFTVVIGGRVTLSFTGLGLTPPSGGGGSSSAPEPATLGLLGLGLLGAQLARRVRRRR